MQTTSMAEQFRSEAVQRQRQYLGRVFEATKATMELLTFLDIHHYEVLGIEINGNLRTPLVHIANSLKCGHLKESYHAYTVGQRPGVHGLEIIWRADLFGCRVQWTEKGN